MKIKGFLICVVFFVILFSGCAAPVAAPAKAAAAPATPAAPAPAKVMAESSGQTADQSKAANLDSSASMKRIVIKNAVLSIIVKDPAVSMDAIGDMAERMGGFIVESNIRTVQTGDGVELPQAAISIRVPAERLTQALENIKKEVNDPGKGVVNEQVNGTDVTKEYTDLQSRLTNLNNASDQLKSIMAKAEKTEDVMSVYNQLKDVNEQIEVIKGQIKYYDEASNLSEISVTLISAETVKPISVAGWEPVGVARDAIQTLIHTLQILISITIWMGLFFLPILLLFGLVIYIPFIVIRKITMAGKKNKKTGEHDMPR